MPKHVSEWLNAYLDGELRGAQLQQVEAHLMECQICQEELESLQEVSALLREVPAPAFTPPERFAAQLNLRLPHQQARVPRKKVFEIGWWMLPIGLLGAWVFISTSVLVNDLLSAAHLMGLLTSVSDWLVFDPVTQAYWSAALGQFGILSGNSLSWVARTEMFTEAYLPQITLYISIALLYLSWLAVEWARYRRRQPGKLLED